MLAKSGHGAVASAGIGHGGEGGTIIEEPEAHDINSSALLNSRAVGRNLDSVGDGDDWRIRLGHDFCCHVNFSENRHEASDSLTYSDIASLKMDLWII